MMDRLVPALLALAAMGFGAFIFSATLNLTRRIAGNDPRGKAPRGPLWKGTFKLSRRDVLWSVAALAGLVIAVLVDLDLGVWSLLVIGSVWTAVKWGPRWKMGWDLSRRSQVIEDLFPQSLGMAIQALKTGQTIPQTLLYLSEETPAPLADEWKRVCSEIELGSSPEDALSQMALRLRGLDPVQRFVEAYRISRRTGANLTRLLEVLLDGMEEKARILRRMKAMTAQARLSGLLMGSLPFFLGAVFFLMDPTMMMPLFTDKLGWGILLAAVLLESAGFLWIRQLLRLEV
ncbi:MAG TPA: type II secretion system F family protein [bacterium]|nr:type II secretion system F family protein [bacterium]